MGVLMATKIGNSGMEYTFKKIDTGNRYSNCKRLTVSNSQTKEIIFTLSTKCGLSAPPAVQKTFYGFDDRYYHASFATGSFGKSLIIGQVTPSGAVIHLTNRTIIKRISFYPVYTEGIKEPEVLKPIIKAPTIPPVSASPTVISIIAPPVTTKEEISWIEKIKNLLTKMKTWMINLLNR